MASLFEIYDTSTLSYDSVHGASSGDVGGGPPTLFAGAHGWIRTGAPDDPDETIVGEANCDLWTSADPSLRGTVMLLGSNWTDLSTVWRPTTFACSTLANVWCVED
jgi:hypothetical protein